MIVEDAKNGQKAVVVTHPIFDRILAVLFVVVPVVFLVWYLSGDTEVGSEFMLVVAFGLVFIVMGLSILRTKIVVHRSFIEERGLIRKKRRVDLSKEVSIERTGPLVCLSSSSDGVEYRFSKYLNHGRNLERSLRRFFGPIE